MTRPESRFSRWDSAIRERASRGICHPDRSAPRLGDNGKRAIFELVDFNPGTEEDKESKKSKKSKESKK